MQKDLEIVSTNQTGHVPKKTTTTKANPVKQE